MMKKFTFLAVASAIFVQGCTSMTPQTRQYLTNNQKQLRQSSVSIISDGCLLRPQVLKSHVMYEQSVAMNNALSNTLKQLLQAKGISSQKTVTPFVCGVMDKKNLVGYHIKMQAKADAKKITHYPILNNNNNNSKVLNDAYIALFKTIQKADVPKKANEKQGYKPAELKLDAQSLAAIKQSLPTSKAFVVTAIGQQPSFARAMVSGMISYGIANAAGASNFYAPSKGQVYSVYLVDFEKNQVIWLKRATPFNAKHKAPYPAVYKAPNMLVPYFEK